MGYLYAVLDYQQLYEQELASKTELVAMVNQWKHAYDELYVHHQQTSEQQEARLKMLAFEMEQLRKLIYGSR